MPSAKDTFQHDMRALYVDHHRWLLDWLRRRVGCAASAADLAQDTFVRLLDSRDALLGLREPRAFLTVTARRLLIDRGRRQRIEQAFLAEMAVLAQTAGFAPSPEQIHAAVESLELIGAALEGLATKPRQAFLLHHLDGLGHDEIAANLGVSARMVRKYLVQALLHCHQVLD